MAVLVAADGWAIVTAIAAVIVAVPVLLSVVTPRGRMVRKRIRDRVSRTPSVPRTRVLLEPSVYSCFWSSSPDPDGGPLPLVYFKMACSATSVTPTIDVHIVSARLVDVRGEPVHSNLMSWQSGSGWVDGAVLKEHEPTSLVCDIVLSRPVPPSGPVVGKVELRDNYGHGHRTSKIKFKDANRPPTDGGSGVAAEPDDEAARDPSP